MSNVVVVVQETDRGYIIRNIDLNKKAGFSHYITQSAGRYLVKDVMDKVKGSFASMDQAVRALRAVATSSTSVTRLMAEVI